MPINNNEEFKQDFDRKISTKKLFTEEDKLNIIYKARNLDNKKQKYNSGFTDKIIIIIQNLI